MSTKAAFYSKISIIYLIFKNDITTDSRNIINAVVALFL